MPVRQRRWFRFAWQLAVLAGCLTAWLSTSGTARAAGSHDSGNPISPPTVVYDQPRYPNSLDCFEVTSSDPGVEVTIRIYLNSKDADGLLNGGYLGPAEGYTADLCTPAQPDGDYVALVESSDGTETDLPFSRHFAPPADTSPFWPHTITVSRDCVNGQLNVTYNDGHTYKYVFTLGDYDPVAGEDDAVDIDMSFPYANTAAGGVSMNWVMHIQAWGSHAGEDSGSGTIVVPDCTVPNQPPVANNDQVTVQAGSIVTVEPLANDSDPDGDSLILTGVDAPTNGVATPSGNTVAYQPNPGFSGADSFAYTISDNRGGTATAFVYVTVLAAPTTASPSTPTPVVAPPTPPITAPTAVIRLVKQTGPTIQLDASRSTDISANSYAWTFGDRPGQNHGPTANHTYAKGGRYTVTLTVTGPAGTASTELQVSIPQLCTVPRIFANQSLDQAKRGLRLGNCQLGDVIYLDSHGTEVHPKPGAVASHWQGPYIETTTRKPVYAKDKHGRTIYVTKHQRVQCGRSTCVKTIRTPKIAGYTTTRTLKLARTGSTLWPGGFGKGAVRLALVGRVSWTPTALESAYGF